MRYKNAGFAVLLLGALLASPAALAERISPQGPPVKPPAALPLPTPRVPIMAPGIPPGLPRPGMSNSLIQINSDSATQQLPAGTLLKLRFLNALHSNTSRTGEPFAATLTDDVMGAYGRVLLPKGTTLRGRLLDVDNSRFFGRGGMIRLGFDHVVLPTGQQQPIHVELSTMNEVVNDQGALYTDPGLVAKLGQSIDDGGQLFSRLLQSGVEAGRDIGNGAGMIVTVPVTAIGGAIAGTSVAVGKGAYSLVAKGEQVHITPDQVVVAQLGKAQAFPVAD